MRAEVIARQREAMRKHGLDALVAISPENVAYATGFVVPSQPLMRWRHAMAVVTADGRTAMVSVDMEETTVRGRLADVETRIWGEFTDNPMQCLAALLSDLGLARARVGLEFDYLPTRDYASLAARLPRAALVPAEALFDRLRQFKTPEEIALLRRLSRISDKAILDSFKAVKPGSSEMDIAAALTRSVYEQGAEHFKLMIVATGERSQLPNVGPSERRLAVGDVCRVEIFAIIGGYHAGVCRTAVVGKAPPEAERIYANLVACKYLVLDMIKPGASSRAVYEAFLRKFGELGLPPISFVGHGIGLHLHEEPYLGKYADTPLDAGTVLGIEPLCYRTGHGFGMQLKDMVRVTETGSELLSDVTDTDRLFVIG
ncbi:MAG: aminopeptidase P family protein [Alphaproteobacteria bacterium]|nr:aminopeptidase P family protein [Alphaproteobacteria bacterium]